MDMPTSNAGHADRVIVIGASAGGVGALMRLVAGWSEPLPVPTLIVLHVGAHPSRLPNLLAHRCSLDVAHAEHGEVLKAGTIRVAPPDHHLMIADHTLVLSSGPKENFARPAIDPLFRSAALSYGPGAIGVVLTGLLDDGTAGLQAIKARGGIAVVQDPRDAAEPSMPASALRHGDIDHCLALQDLPALLASLASSAAEPRKEPDMTSPDWLEHEQALSEGTGDFMAHLAAISTPSGLTCPECHGGLWSVNGAQPRRFRCHTGHAFTERTLGHALTIGSDAALWNALRALHERQVLARQLIAGLSRSVDVSGVPAEMGQLREAADRLERQIAALRRLIEHSPAVVEQE
jgi:two-component system chemotaxis response regulator CheB